MENETRGMLLGVIGVIAFGLTLPATKLVIPYLDPLFIGFGRAVLAALFAVIFLFWFRQSLPTKKQIYRLIIIALGVVVGFPVFSSWAMQYVSASHGGVVVGLVPLATAIAGVLISHERPSIAFWLVGCVGCLIVISYTLLQGAGELHIADVALFLSVISAAVGYAVGAKLSKELGGWQVICWALVIAFPFILIPAIIRAPEDLFALPFSAYASFLYLALISQLLAFFVWYKGLALGGIARVSQTQLLQPFVTVFASVLMLGELIQTQTAIFALLIVATVWLSKQMPIKRKI